MSILCFQKQMLYDTFVKWNLYFYDRSVKYTNIFLNILYESFKLTLNGLNLYRYVCFFYHLTKCLYSFFLYMKILCFFKQMLYDTFVKLNLYFLDRNLKYTNIFLNI